jgi:tetratricopeptide (TPR) repeat protein
LNLEDEAQSLLDAARVARHESEFLDLERIATQLVRLGATGASKETAAVGYYHLGIALNNLNRGTEAITATRESIRLYRAIGDRFATAKAQLNLGAIELDNNVNVAEARRLYEEAAPVVREFGGPLNLAIALGNLGEICRLEGDYEGALRNGEESLQLFRDLGDTSNSIWQLTNIAHFQSLLRRYAPAAENMRAAFELLREEPNPRWIAWHFDVWFLIAASLQRWDVAAQLLAFVDEHRDATNQPRLGAMLPWFTQAKERLSRELSFDRHDELLIQGEALDAEAAQTLAEAMPLA